MLTCVYVYLYHREVCDIERFLTATAEREAEAKLQLQTFIEALLERADRAERKLQLLVATDRHAHNDDRHTHNDDRHTHNDNSRTYNNDSHSHNGTNGHRTNGHAHNGSEDDIITGSKLIGYRVRRNNLSDR